MLDGVSSNIFLPSVMCAESYHGNRDVSVKRLMIAMIKLRNVSVRISRDVECVACHDVRQHRRRIRQPPIIMVWEITALWRLSILWITDMLSRQSRRTLNTANKIHMIIQDFVW
ncbi:uncharacterized protein LOC105428446 [Pogonomyrmex barbatus]|uniref:Uncharacterized protein LOC105428446 n=1 Tax=Pogonomyrmex barbatus TaxID=144034 RepID=A0A6I9X3R6_9HYME|nr:uncharacterized protein LOC105428446 [Pogonomyrmex barbatus]